MFCLAFSPDGKTIVSGSLEIIKVWNVASGECLQTLEGHVHDILSVDFSSDNSKFATASVDKTVKIWDTPRADERRREIKEMMLSLRRANRRTRDQLAIFDPQKQVARVYNPDLHRKIATFL